MRAGCPCISAPIPSRAIAAASRQVGAEVHEFPVVDGSGTLLGAISRATLRRVLDQQLLNPQRCPPAASGVIDRVRKRLSDTASSIRSSSASFSFKSPTPPGNDAEMAELSASECTCTPASSRPQSDIAEVADGLTVAELALLDLPLDLDLPVEVGPDGIGLLPSSSERHVSPLVNLAPTVVLAGASIQQVHVQFALFTTEHAYVTYAGRYLGVIRRSDLSSSADG